MAKNREFYRGQKKRRNFALIPFVVGLALITLAVVAFYGLQKYVVITKDGVQVVLPGEEQNKPLDPEKVQERSFEAVPVDLVFDEPDYSRITARAGRKAKPMRAIYIAAEDVNRENLLKRAEQLNSGNALVLEMKPRSGYLLWVSDTQLARSYSLSVQNELTSDMAGMLQDIRDYGTEQGKDIWLAAQISCCVDGLLATRTSNYALRTENGSDYIDDTGYWLDPYNADLRRYVIELINELYEIGFDEVILADVRHPVPQDVNGQAPMSFLYTREMSAAPSPINAICGFALYISNEMEDRPTGKMLSIYLDTARSLVRYDEGTGQNGVLFFKLYDRIYYRTDRYTYTYNYKDIESSVTIGSPNDRFVPVVINYLPDNSSWVYIEDLPALAE
ncbi:MAG: hypothetical protein IKH34_10135 [Oscillospiraceae bacterium]|nr:hypothetical protein [Oscillospiraceae bacterium]